LRSRTKDKNLNASRILKACINGTRKTRITHQAGPNSIRVISYLLLIDEGLIEVIHDGSGTVHRTTPKGLSLIEKIEPFHEATRELIL
jgi:predicted transcriptional regulator